MGRDISTYDRYIFMLEKEKGDSQHRNMEDKLTRGYKYAMVGYRLWN